MEDRVSVNDEFEIPEDAKPKESIPYTIKSEARREKCVLALTLEIPYEEYGRRMSEALRDLKKNVVVPGFRKGKAPEDMIRRRFGKDLEKDTVTAIAPLAFNKYVEEKKVRLASEATMEDFHVETDKPLVIDYQAELMPEVKIETYAGLAVEVPFEETAEDPSERHFAYLKNMFASRQTLEEPVSREKGVTLSARVEDERGKAVKNLTFENKGTPKLDGAMPEEVIAALVGRKAGDTVTATVARERKGASGTVYSTRDTYHVTVVDVFEMVEPEITDEWLKTTLGHEGGVADYKKTIAVQAETDRAEAKRDAAVEKIFDAIREKNPFEIPDSLVRRQWEILFDQEAQRLEERFGKAMARNIAGSQRFADALWGRAEKLVAMAFIGDAIATTENVEISEADLDAEIARRAEAQGRKPLAVRAALERHKQLDRLREILREKKVSDALLEKNTVTYVAPPPPAEHDHAHDHAHDHEHGPDCGPDCGHEH